MESIDLIAACKVASYYESLINKLGITLKISGNFKKLSETKNAVGYSITPHFSIHTNTFTRDDAFWIGAYHGNAPVGTIACKLQRLGELSLAEYTQMYWSRVYSLDAKTDVKLSKKQRRILNNIYGNVIYSGEWAVHEKYQKKGIGILLGHYAKVLAYLEYRDATFLYIFMEPDSVQKFAYPGFLKLDTLIDHAIQWDKCPPHAREDYWLIGLTRLHFLDWLDYENSKIQAN